MERRWPIYLASKLRIIEELGDPPPDTLGAIRRFRLVAARYERGRDPLANEPAFRAWGEALGHPITTTAILGRLPRHRHFVDVRGASCRRTEKRRSGLLRARTERPG